MQKKIGSGTRRDTKLSHRNKIETKTTSKNKEAKKLLLTKENNVDKQELTSPGSRGAWKESQIDYIEHAQCACMKILYLVFITFGVRVFT